MARAEQLNKAALNNSWGVVAAGAKVRIFDGKNTSLHGSKHETAALTAMPNCIAPTPRKGYASPGCISPQPALDPATRPYFSVANKHFLCPKKTLHHICALLDRR